MRAPSTREIRKTSTSSAVANVHIPKRDDLMGFREIWVLQNVVHMNTKVYVNISKILI